MWNKKMRLLWDLFWTNSKNSEIKMSFLRQNSELWVKKSVFWDFKFKYEKKSHNSEITEGILIK